MQGNIFDTTTIHEWINYVESTTNFGLLKFYNLLTRNNMLTTAEIYSWLRKELDSIHESIVSMNVTESEYNELYNKILELTYNAYHLNKE